MKEFCAVIAKFSPPWYNVITLVLADSDEFSIVSYRGSMILHPPTVSIALPAIFNVWPLETYPRCSSKSSVNDRFNRGVPLFMFSCCWLTCISLYTTYACCLFNCHFLVASERLVWQKSYNLWMHLALTYQATLVAVIVWHFCSFKISKYSLPIKKEYLVQLYYFHAVVIIGYLCCLKISNSCSVNLFLI